MATRARSCWRCRQDQDWFCWLWVSWRVFPFPGRAGHADRQSGADELVEPREECAVVVRELPSALYCRFQGCGELGDGEGMTNIANYPATDRTSAKATISDVPFGDT